MFDQLNPIPTPGDFLPPEPEQPFYEDDLVVITTQYGEYLGVVEHYSAPTRRVRVNFYDDVFGVEWTVTVDEHRLTFIAEGAA